MTTSDQAALLAKHLGVHQETGEYVESEMTCSFCYERTFVGKGYDRGISLHPQSAPCDVHRMAELKDAEIADAVSEAVERIVSALSKEGSTCELAMQMAKGNGDGPMAVQFSGRVVGIADAIALLRSRDWSKGEG